MNVPPGLAGEGLRPLWEAVHYRMSSGRSVVQVRIGPLNERQRTAVADLLGMLRNPDEYCTVSLDRLDGVLSEAGTDVRTVVTTLLGPIGDRAARRSRAEADRTQLWSWLRSHDVVMGQPDLTTWVEHVRKAGVLEGSVERTREVLGTAWKVLSRLPAEGQPLPTVANEIADDPHALDDGTRLSNLVLRALAAVFDKDMPATAEDRRAL